MLFCVKHARMCGLGGACFFELFCRNRGLDVDGLDAGFVEHMLRGQVGHFVDKGSSEGTWTVDISTGARMFSCKV